jgi:hypothetical protein
MRMFCSGGPWSWAINDPSSKAAAAEATPIMPSAYHFVREASDRTDAGKVVQVGKSPMMRVMWLVSSFCRT